MVGLEEYAVWMFDAFTDNTNQLCQPSTAFSFRSAIFLNIHR
jgi:hypothetical protein